MLASKIFRTSLFALVGMGFIVSACSSKVEEAPTTSTASEATTWWRPASGTTWQIQYTDELDTTVDVVAYDLDGFDTSRSTVDELHAAGRKTICYFSAGSYEEWRPDAASFPARVRGEGLDGWPGESWLDIRDLATLQPIMEKRLDLCKEKGFDAVDPDNVDGYANETGFALTAEEQLRYLTWLAAEAHERGMAIGLKNDLDQIPQLVDSFDFAVNEQCALYDECDALLPFTDAGKAVFHIEYELATGEFCDRVPAGLSSLQKDLELSAYRRTC